MTLDSLNAISELLPQNRFDIGFGNPNKSAALFAQIIPATWCVVPRTARHFMACLSVSFILGLGLILTGSRAGILSAIVGVAVIALVHWRQFEATRRHLILGAITLLILIMPVCHPAERVFADATADLSVLNRLAIWKVTPQMMVAAPGGWGWGASGTAFMQWYQDVDRYEEYRTLVNSHLTWMIEQSWLFRIAYIFGWAFVLLLPLNVLSAPVASATFGTWISFAIGSFFSSVAEEPALWITPVVLLLLGFVYNPQWRVRIPAIAGLAAVCAVIATFCLYCVGMFLPADIPISKPGDAVIVGNSHKQFWLVAPKPTIVGNLYGHEIRRTLKSLPSNQAELSFGVTEDFFLVPNRKCYGVIVSGSNADELHRLSESGLKMSRLFLINPEVSDNEASELTKDFSDVILIRGSLCGKSSSADIEFNSRDRQLSRQTVEGFAQYIPHWPSLVCSLDVQSYVSGPP